MLAHITNTSALAGMERVRMEESCPAKGGGGPRTDPCGAPSISGGPILHPSARRRNTAWLKEALALRSESFTSRKYSAGKINKCVSSKWCCYSETSRMLRKDVGDEVTEAFGVLFGVDRGDFSSGLEDTDVLEVSAG